MALSCPNVRNFFNTDKDSQECTPNSTSDISRSRQDTVINLVQDDPDADEDTSTDVPSHARPKKATNWIWDYVHHLDETVMHNGAEYTHICLLCLQNNGKTLCCCVTIDRRSGAMEESKRQVP
ncbi:hypothetical protein DVH05_027762 [Phytophthora capsici]|nr:hypothetical protein DVH05_027762 [Phytophthora capsici]